MHLLQTMHAAWRQTKTNCESQSDSGDLKIWAYTGFNDPIYWFIYVILFTVLMIWQWRFPIHYWAWVPRWAFSFLHRWRPVAFDHLKLLTEASKIFDISNILNISFRYSGWKDTIMKRKLYGIMHTPMLLTRDRERERETVIPAAKIFPELLIHSTIWINFEVTQRNLLCTCYLNSSQKVHSFRWLGKSNTSYI